MVEMTFEEWWQDTHEITFSNMPGALQLTFKEIAKHGWDAGYASGYEKSKKDGDASTCTCRSDVGM
jgi:hypothetical protein